MYEPFGRYAWFPAERRLAMNTTVRALVAAAAMAAVLSACGDDAPADELTTTATAPTPSATETGASTDDVSEESESFGQLVDVRVGEHSGFDRVVFEFADEMPGYVVKYVELPVYADGSGEPVDLPKAETAVQVTFTPASGFDMEAGEETYTGPDTVTGAKTAEITGAVSAGDFESLLSWAVGLRHEVPFKVSKLESPARLVIDFQVD